MKSSPWSKWAKAVAWSALAVLLLFAAFWVHLLNHAGIDDWLERRFLQYASHSTATKEEVPMLLLLIDPEKTEGLGTFDDDIAAAQKWRSHHAKLLDKLVAAKTPLVMFDLSFAAPVTEFESANGDLVNAIAAAKRSGSTQVLVGLESNRDPNLSLEAVLPREAMGLVSMKEITYDAASDRYVSRVLLAESIVETTAVGSTETIMRPLPMPLAMYFAYKSPNQVVERLSIDPARGGLVIYWKGGESSLIDAEIRSCTRGDTGCVLPSNAAADTISRRAVLPLWMGRELNFSTDNYAIVLNKGPLGKYYSERVVIVGALTAKEKQLLGPGAPEEDTYGVYVQARVFSDLVSNNYARHASAWLQLLSFVAVLLLGLLARLYLPVKGIKIPLEFVKEFSLPVGFSLVVGAYLITAAMIFRDKYIFFDLGYQLLALVAGYYAVPKLAKLTEPAAEPAKEAPK